ncbi:MAG: hypothetical protein OEW26_01220, partial [Nitrospirota bacterium]|nr:hypothetical protein [Nitrospirota bacterium]
MIFLRLVRTMILGGILMSIFLPLTSAWGRISTVGIGGDGGTPFNLDCGESAFLVGVAGRSG